MADLGIQRWIKPGSALKELMVQMWRKLTSGKLFLKEKSAIVKEKKKILKGNLLQKSYNLMIFNSRILKK